MLTGKLGLCLRRGVVATLSLFAVATLSLFASSLTFGEIIAGYPDDFANAYDPREVAILPAYCKYTQLFRQHVPGGNDPVEIERMYATLGPGFHALHHYCWAIMGTHR